MLHRSTHMLPHASHCAHSRDASLHGFGCPILQPGGVSIPPVSCPVSRPFRVSPSVRFGVLSRVFCMLASGRKVLALVAFFHHLRTHGWRGARPREARSRPPSPGTRLTPLCCALLRARGVMVRASSLTGIRPMAEGRCKTRNVSPLPKHRASRLAGKRYFPDTSLRFPPREPVWP